MSRQILTYEEFVQALEGRPDKDLSPLKWMSTRPDRTPQWSIWMMRWLEESR